MALNYIDELINLCDVGSDEDISKIVSAVIQSRLINNYETIEQRLIQQKRGYFYSIYSYNPINFDVQEEINALIEIQNMMQEHFEKEYKCNEAKKLMSISNHKSFHEKGIIKMILSYIDLSTTNIFRAFKTVDINILNNCYKFERKELYEDYSINRVDSISNYFICLLSEMKNELIELREKINEVVEKRNEYEDNLMCIQFMM